MPRVDRRSGAEKLSTAPWRGDPETAHLVARSGRPTVSSVARHVEELARRGYRKVLTAALPMDDLEPYLANGFTVLEHLHLLSRSVDPPIPGGPAVGLVLSRPRHRDRAAILAVDRAAFPPFWHLDSQGLDDALGATPSARLRVARTTDGPDRVAGYAVTGRAGGRGYLQRLAIHPDLQRRGAATALVADSLRWLGRRGARDVLVNTQVANDGALALYERLGFRQQRDGLAVLELALPGT